jgi:hypothetical protein
MPTSKLGESLFDALTQQELIQLLDSLWATLPAELHNEVLTQLPSDTGQTVGHILSPPQPTYETEPDPVQRASVAKLAESWADAWQMWDSIITTLLKKRIGNRPILINMPLLKIWKKWPSSCDR